MLLLANSMRTIFFKVLALLSLSTTLLTGSVQGSNDTTMTSSISLEIGKKVPKALFSSALGYKGFCDRLLLLAQEHQIGSQAPAMQLPIFCVPYLYFRKEKKPSCACTMEKLDLEAEIPEGTQQPPELEASGVCITYKCPHLERTRKCKCVAHNVVITDATGSSVVDSANDVPDFCDCSFTCLPLSNPAFPMSTLKNCVFALQVKNQLQGAGIKFSNPSAVKCDCDWKRMDQAVCDCYENN